MIETRSFAAWVDELSLHTAPTAIASAIQFPPLALKEHKRRITRIGKGVGGMLTLIANEVPPNVSGPFMDLTPNDGEMFGAMYEDGLVPVVEIIDPIVAREVAGIVQQTREEMDYIHEEVPPEEKNQLIREVLVVMHSQYAALLKARMGWRNEARIGVLQEFLWAKFTAFYANRVMQDPLLQESDDLQELFRSDLQIGFAA